MHNGYWQDSWHGSGNWWWIPMTLMMIAFWGGLAWVLVAFLRRSAPQPTVIQHPPSTFQPPPQLIDPRQLLAERLARGDIEIEDYRARLDALGHTPPQT